MDETIRGETGYNETMIGYHTSRIYPVVNKKQVNNKLQPRATHKYWQEEGGCVIPHRCQVVVGSQYIKQNNFKVQS